MRPFFLLVSPSFSFSVPWLLTTTIRNPTSPESEISPAKPRQMSHNDQLFHYKSTVDISIIRLWLSTQVWLIFLWLLFAKVNCFKALEQGFPNPNVFTMYRMSLHCIVWYCMVLYYILRYCMVLHCWVRRAGCISQDTYLLYLAWLTRRRKQTSFPSSFKIISALLKPLQLINLQKLKSRIK